MKCRKSLKVSNQGERDCINNVNNREYVTADEQNSKITANCFADAILCQFREFASLKRLFGRRE